MMIDRWLDRGANVAGLAGARGHSGARPLVPAPLRSPCGRQDLVLRLAVAAGLAVSALGCDDDPSASDAFPEATEPATAMEPLPTEVAGMLAGARRTGLRGGIAHYHFDVPLGPGEHDVIRIHRVVRERGAHRPASTRGAVLMAHGSWLTFEAVFLSAGCSDPDAQRSIAVYLAEKGIDVWGLDFGWTRVPPDAADFESLRGWGIGKDAQHALAAAAIARAVRRLGGQGRGPIDLLGYSYGALVAYAAAGRESELPPDMRHLAGIIAVDTAPKFAAADEPSRLSACARAAASRDRLDAGVLDNPGGVTFATLGRLAGAAPDDASPVIPSLTNLQAALFAGSRTYVLSGDAPFWHFVGGEADESGTPTRLLYTDAARWIALLSALPPFMPEQARFETFAVMCDEEDVAFDDQLGAIEAPVLYVGAAGGTGGAGAHAPTLTASDDVTVRVVQRQPDGASASDFGHADLFLGRDAPRLAWRPILDWLARRPGPGR